MARVAMLAHVKETTAVEPLARPTRIPWTGGKIVSNKDEALRKFYERKLRRGADTLTPEQRRVLEASIAKLGDAPGHATNAATISTMKAKAKPPHHHKSKHDTVHKINATTKRKVHHANVKVTNHSKKSMVVNGRVVGPRVHKTTASPAVNTHGTNKKVVGSRPTKSVNDSGIALQDKLGMSLDALVKRNK